MKFNVTSGDLVRSLTAVIGAVPSKATLPILETVLFETEDSRIKLSATDLEVSIIEYVDADIENEGSVAVPARRLIETLRQLPDIPVTFEVDDKAQVRFRTDKGTYKLAGEKSEDFPDMPALTEGQSINIETESLKDAIKKTSFAVSSDDLRPAMMGVFFDIGEEDSRIVATDGHRLVRLVRSDISAAKSVSFIVPEKALTLVGKALDDSGCVMMVTDDHVSFKSGKTMVITRLINEQYPKYESVIPRENDKTLKINREHMLATVKRVAVFSSSTTRQIRLEMKPDEIMISAEDLDMSSEAKESIASEYSDEPMEIGFNARYLLDVLNNIDDPEVMFEFSTPNRAGIVRPSVQDDNEDMLMLVMPVMLNSYS
ncbi:DNA polymerase III subunit beta [Natronogracilivirga saccharolytica]|uniref:Beta sliding clamp n=1 Tax=Natronogracilivirga saccharolytica TaxID=2812953 RepID=A0A8J7S7F2_9BACT|nr:DNA polymerase III subunit beta [Natronogracilivirga saccharolytica]MBP3191516.1 DNA polymerase III subunit beta [Natronogracilivirga saccharolytica]